MSPIPKNVLDPELYAKIKKQIHTRLAKNGTRWGIYASSLLVKTYKKRGGRYSDDSSYKKRKEKEEKIQGLDRWFQEQWINICESDPPKKIVKCGRSSLLSESESQSSVYPVCRPYRRISPQTPTTYGEMDRSTIQSICKKKRRDPTHILPKFN